MTWPKFTFSHQLKTLSFLSNSFSPSDQTILRSSSVLARVNGIVTPDYLTLSHRAGKIFRLFLSQGEVTT